MTQVHPALTGSAPADLVIGEVAMSHDGSLGLAHAFIDAIAAAGADAVKFQTHIAAEESTPSEPFRVKFSEGCHALRLLEAHGDRGAVAGPVAHRAERHVLFVSSPFAGGGRSPAACRAAAVEDRLG
jgi:N-acetylneuraminate synthase